MWVQFVQMKRQNFTVRSAAKSIAVVCDGVLKQRDYFPVLCTRIIYHLLPLKTSVSLKCSLAETAGSSCDSVG